MSWPVPRPGLIIRYSYLWKHEADAGGEEGVKDRPCAVVLAVKDEGGRLRVVVLPVTHAAPRQPNEAVELPRTTKLRLGLDGDQSWIVVTEANVFTWPGPDLRPLPERGTETVAYGYLPPALFRFVRDRFLAVARAQKAGLVPRSE